MRICYLDRFLSQRLAVDPPLGLEDWFNDVSRFSGFNEFNLLQIFFGGTYTQIGICIGLSFVSM